MSYAKHSAFEECDRRRPRRKVAPHAKGSNGQAGSGGFGSYGRLLDPDEQREEILDALKDLEPGENKSVHCPAHEERNPSLSVGRSETGKILLRCHVGCTFEEVVAAYRRLGVDLLRRDDQDGCTLEEYAEAKRLPIEFLRGLGLRDVSYLSAAAVRIPYRGEDGQELAIRFRTALDGPDRFRWKAGSKPLPYGLERLDDARKAGFVVLVEGESDCHTLWHHGVPALGIPGASSWRDQWGDYLDGIPSLYVVREPDQGGETLLRRLGGSALRDRLYVLDLGELKDPSELYLADPEQFLARWRAAISKAIPWRQYADEEARRVREEAWGRCEELARAPDILGRFAAELEAAGVVGVAREAKLVYLAVTSRLLDRPVSVAIKGPSSGGKSYLVERVLAFFPPDAFYALTAMSERTLAYDDEPLRHRMLVIYEAQGMGDEMGSYLVRSLLSEGRIRYKFVEKTSDGLRPRLVEREGPTGLIVTTTRPSLHPENETRLLSLTVDDTPEQTKAVMRALARGHRHDIDAGPWHALQTWLEHGERRVSVPYAEALADVIPPVAVRLRRDFGTLLNLICAHALLHQASRERDDSGQIVATVEDYAAVRELVADLLSEGVEATVSPETRETVEAVARLSEAGQKAEEAGVTVSMVADELELDPSAASRRVRVAIERGYLRNLETRKGLPFRLVLGDPLPVGAAILPRPEKLAERVPRA